MAMTDAVAYSIALAVPVLSLIYAAGDYRGWWESLRGRAMARNGLARLSSNKGYPVCWIYSDEMQFPELERFLRTKTKNQPVRELAEQGITPSLISVGAVNQDSVPVPENWPSTRFVPGTSPILFIYGVTREGGKGKAAWVASLDELRQWLNHEREVERYSVQSVLLGLLAVAVAALAA